MSVDLGSFDKAAKGCFVAGGFNSAKEKGKAKNQPHYVIFHS